jgi:Clp amino terminal domain, pathogenicity island component
MMFERFTDSARHLVVQAQHEARRLGHNYIGCEHLLLAAAGIAEPAGAVLRDQGVTPERVEAEIVRTVGRGQAADPSDRGQAADPSGRGRAADPSGRGDPLHGLDREALASIGIDLDVVRARLEAAFGPDALDRAVLAHRRAAQASRSRRRPAWRKGPVAELMRRRRARRGAPPGPGPGRAAPGQRPGPAPGGHIPFTPRAKKSLELSLREAKALHDDYIGVQHLILGQLAISDGMPRLILSALGASAESLRADILARYRKAS